MTYSSLVYNEDFGYVIFSGSDSSFYLFKEKALKDVASLKKISQENHNGSIVGLSLAVSKPFFVSCSTDRQIKIWNYLTNELVNSLIMNEDAISVHFHPSGLHLGIAFSDKLIIQNVYPECLESKKRGSKEIAAKNITCVEFSKGGDKIAIASGNP